MWEDWTITGSNSMSHGWGARGINSMLTYLLGISVTSPGAATVSIAPPDKGLDHASGSQWTQRGTVGVSWKRRAGDHVLLDVTVPDNVQSRRSRCPTRMGRATPPPATGRRSSSGVEGGRAVFTVGSGHTRFAVATTVTFTAASATSAQYRGVATFAATVADDLGPVANGLVTFSLGRSGSACTATTNASGLASCSLTLPAAETAGDDTVTATFAATGDDLAASATAPFTVTKAPLTVTADDQSRLFGAANPPLTATLSGFVGGETLATSGVTGVASCSTTATSFSAVGPIRSSARSGR